MPKHNSREEAEYIALPKEQNYILKTISDFTLLNEQERENLKKIYERYQLVWE